MTDIRTRIADALVHEIVVCDRLPNSTSFNYGDRLADAVLSLPGIGIVELPEPRPWLYAKDDMPCWDSPGGDIEANRFVVDDVQHGEVCYYTHIYSPAQAREVAACLLAAANTAEEALHD